MRVGESNVEFTLDSQAGLPGMVPSIANALCTLVVKLRARPADPQSRVVVDATRVTPLADGRTLTYAGV